MLENASSSQSGLLEVEEPFYSTLKAAQLRRLMRALE
jgi:hypothetical protein